MIQTPLLVCCPRHSGKVSHVLTGDADITQELAANQMPTFHIFKNGDLKDSVTGAKAQPLEKAIKENYEGKVEEE